MLLQSRIDDDTVLFIDTEVTGAFGKGDDDLGFHPDAILDNVVKVSAHVARRLAEAAANATAGEDAPPSSLSLEFGIKVDSNSVVSVASDINRAHFRVRAEWTPRV